MEAGTQCGVKKSPSAASNGCWRWALGMDSGSCEKTIERAYGSSSLRRPAFLRGVFVFVNRVETASCDTNEEEQCQASGVANVLRLGAAPLDVFLARHEPCPHEYQC